MQRELRFVVTPAQGGLRVDQFLASTGAMSRRKARALLSDGAVYLNRRRVKIASRRVRPGDQCRCYVETSPRPEASGALEILQQDPHFVVVDKPAGMPVQATVTSDRGTVVEAVWRLLGRPNVRPRIVHRLDRPVSGAIVLARTRRAAADLSEQMTRHEIRRRYLVAVEGHCTRDRRLVHYLTRLSGPPGAGPSGRRVHARRAEGPARPDERAAITAIRPLVSNERLSLLLATLETGRTHQVRAQLGLEGLPVAGDLRYGARDPIPGYPGIALHAWTLEFRHPATSRPVRVIAPLPGPLQAWLQWQGLSAPAETTSAQDSATNEARHGQNRDEEAPLPTHGNRQETGG